MNYATIVKSQVEIRLINIDQVRVFLKKNPNCISQICSHKEFLLFNKSNSKMISLSIIKPASMNLNKRNNEKTKQKIC